MELLYNIPVASFLIGLILPIVLYWYATRHYSYWKKKGVPHAPARPISETFSAPPEKPFQDEEQERYRTLGRVHGHFDTNFSSKDPAISVGDPDLLRDILVKDFQFFSNRRDIGSQDSIVSRMVSSLRGDDWKRVRSIISPTFSTGKLKRVMSIFEDCSKTLLQNFKMAAQKGDPIEVKRLYGTFTMDVIASAAFSTKIDSANDPNNQFVKTAREVFFVAPNWKANLLRSMPPFVRNQIMKFFASSSKLEFFKEATLQIISERKRTGQTRNDFLQLLVDAATQVSSEEKWETDDIAANYGDDASNHPVFKGTTSKRLSMDELVAQCVIFFLAGYHTTSSTLSYLSYLLALNPTQQEKAHREIKEVLKETNGELTYEALQKMKYLDNVISETLRLYPPAPRLERICSTNYRLGDTGITIPEGMTVIVPVYAIHRDPEFFQDPEKFDPDRFSPEQRSKQVPYSYLPFGAGPRNCVGMRFALVELKVCLVHILTAFRIKKCPETKVPLEFRRGGALLSPKDIVVKMEIRSDCPLKI